MKKAIAIFFCLQILSGNTFPIELFKLPSLFHHYFEHERYEHPDLTFTAFLSEHYLGDHADEAKGHCDEKLPFKHCNDCCTHNSSMSAFVVPDELISVSTEISEHEFIVSSYVTVRAGYLECIWQPPKVT